MTTEPVTDPIGATDPPGRGASVLPALAVAWSLVTTTLGVWWLARPDAYPFTPGTAEPSGTILDVTPAAVVPPALVAAGLCGLVVAGPGRRHRGLVLGTGLVYAVVFGLALPGLQPLTLTGYLMAMFGPVVLLIVLVAGAWRRRGGPVTLALLAIVGVVAWGTGIADGTALTRYAGVVIATLPKFGPPAALLALLAGGLLWGVLAVRTAIRGRAGGPAARWTRPESAARWGRVAAVVAAVCALPYGVQRLTWLTPWPLAGDAAMLAATPELRLHGLLLGLSALAGALLTLGLIARWGEVWPRWMPAVRGRPVPPAAAIVPGALVATLFTAAAFPISLMWISAGEPWAILIFPFPVWGPALGIAVLGYALRRRGEKRVPGTIERT